MILIPNNLMLAYDVLVSTINLSAINTYQYLSELPPANFCLRQAYKNLCFWGLSIPVTFGKTLQYLFSPIQTYIKDTLRVPHGTSWREERTSRVGITPEMAHYTWSFIVWLLSRDGGMA